MKTLVRVLAVCVLFANISCSGSNSAGSPVAPGSTVLQGSWTGTLTRPAGLPAIGVVRWEPTQAGDYSLTGPITLTNNGMSVTIKAQGNVAGNDNSGYTIHMSFQSNSGDISALPNCAIRGNTNGAQAGDPFPKPFNSITVPSFSISYAGCRGFIDVSGLGDFVQETAQLSLTKQ
jgi:hypothetical protein